MSWVGIGGAVVSAGVGIYSSNQQKKAADKALQAQQDAAGSIKYEPIDIEKLRNDATNQAIENAANSLAIERKLDPTMADTRSELTKQVNADLHAGGNLPADVLNQVNQAGRVIGAQSNIGAGGTTPLTAGLLGLSSLDLIKQRRAAASNLLGQNPLPTGGLDPSELVNLEIARNNQVNQFSADKAGVDANLAESEKTARAAQIAGQVGLVNQLGSSALSIYNKNKKPVTTTSGTPVTRTSSTPTTTINPTMNLE